MGGERKCTPGITRKCGKTCRSLYKPCKIDGTQGKNWGKPNTVYDQKLIDKAVKLRKKATALNPNSAEWDRANTEAIFAYEMAEASGRERTPDFTSAEI